MTVRKRKATPAADTAEAHLARALQLAEENAELRLEVERAANRHSAVFTERNRLGEQLNEVRRELVGMTQRAETAEHRVSFLEGFLTATEDAISPPVTVEERRPRRGWQSPHVMSDMTFGSGRGY